MAPNGFFDPEPLDASSAQTPDACAASRAHDKRASEFAELIGMGSPADAVRRECERLVRMLSSPLASERHAAAVGLAAVGEPSCAGPLAEALYDEDADVAEASESALSAVWMRSGSDEAVGLLVRGMALLDREDCPAAAEAFTRAIAADPTYAEAYVQRGIATMLCGGCCVTPAEMAVALTDFERAIRLAPLHFVAHASAGNCHAALGNLPAAAGCLRRAVAINPHLDCAIEALAMIRQHTPPPR